jgi:hypothetical protein
MSATNIATCFAPCLLKAENPLTMIEDSPATNRIISLLINNADTVFEVEKIIIFVSWLLSNHKPIILELRKLFMRIRVWRDMRLNLRWEHLFSL